MHILHLAHQYLPDNVGGTELYTHWLVQELIRQGHRNTIFYRRSGEGTGLDHRTDEIGAQTWAVWSGPLTPQRRFLATFRERAIFHAFERVLAETQPDVVHIQHLMGLPAVLVKQVQKIGLPFVITLHDYWWGCANAQLLTNYNQQVCLGPQAYLNCARCALARFGQPYLWLAAPSLVGLLVWRNFLLRQILQGAAQLIAPTEFVRRWYVSHGVPAERLTVIPHGLDVPALSPRPTRVPGSPLRFAYIGGLSWQKGVHILVEAFRGIERGAELWIAGDEATDPAYSASLRAQASPQIHFLGKLTRPEVWTTLAQIDVVVVPTLWYETFSFIVSEAFASGAPVIASQIGPLADRVRDGLDGRLVPPGDKDALREALLQFIQYPTLLPRLQSNLHPPYTLTAHTQEIETVYQTVLAQAKY